MTTEHEIARNCSADVTLGEASCKKMFVNPDKVAIASTRSTGKSKIHFEQSPSSNITNKRRKDSVKNFYDRTVDINYYFVIDGQINVRLRRIYLLAF